MRRAPGGGGGIGGGGGGGGGREVKGDRGIFIYSKKKGMSL